MRILKNIIFTSLVCTFVLFSCGCGHSHDLIITDPKIPTCTESGHSTGARCAECGETVLSAKEYPALGHSPVTDKAVAPTYTETGLTEGSHCKICGLVIVKQETVPVLEQDTSSDNSDDSSNDASEDISDSAVSDGE